ncbi:MAG: hypothetical protein JNN04_02855 [Cyclobacteriaceae bacterium]|nr:hypothetical protein [Cyclobacteriaceae bacterium]
MSLHKWIVFTSLGWIAGIPLLILIAGALEPIGLGNTSIALGMSAAIAFFQWLVLRRFLTQASRWIWISASAFIIPFLIADLLGDKLFSTPETAIVSCTIVSSVLLAIGQFRFILKGEGVQWPSWVTVNLVSYALALVPPFVLTVGRIRELNLPEALSVGLSFLTVLAGGPIIGWLTGIILCRYIRKAEPSQ